MAASSFFQALSFDLREKVRAQEDTLTPSQKYLLVKTFGASLEELSKITTPDHNEEYSNFLAGHAIFRLKREGPIGTTGTDYIKHFDYLLSKDFPFKASINALLTSIVTHEIQACKNVEDILLWLKSINPLKRHNADLNSINRTAELCFIAFMMERINQIHNPEHEGVALAYLIDLKSAQDYDLDLDSLISLSLTQICRYLELQAKIPKPNPEIANTEKKKYRTERMCLGCIETLKFNSDVLRKRLEKIQALIGKPIALEKKLEKPAENARIYIDLDLIKLGAPLYANQTPKFGVVIYRASHPDCPLLAVKEYTARLNPEDLQDFNSEIEIMQKLSDYASPTNCFLKFYGSKINGNKLFLVMEHVDQDMSKVIESYRKNNTRISEEDLRKVAYNVISSFAQMEVMGIYHQDIKPQNLLVTKDFSIKIIDFSISEVKADMNMTMTGINFIQGTKGFMAPELQDYYEQGSREGKFSQGRADVFSLGMTLLQLVVVQDLYTLNRREYHGRLLQKVELVQIEWFKSLLHYMLALDYHGRKRFKYLLSMIPTELATTQFN